MCVSIKKKKLLVTTFLQALGFSREELISRFYGFDTVRIEKGEFLRAVDDTLMGQRIEKGMVPEFLAKTWWVST